MPAGTYNFYIEKGATFMRVFEYKDTGGTPINISSYTARLQVRPTVSSNTVLIDANTTNGKITINGPLGQVILVIPATETASVSSGCVTGVYDLEIQSPLGVVTRILQGSVEFSPEVTR